MATRFFLPARFALSWIGRPGSFFPPRGLSCSASFSATSTSPKSRPNPPRRSHCCKSSGVQLTHIDTHKHMHMFPAVLRPVLRAAHAAGIRAVRNPYEPAWSARATPGAPLIRRMQVGAAAPARRRLPPHCRGARIYHHRRRGRRAGHGNARCGHARVPPATLPAGTLELVTHPGYNDADLARVRTRLRDSRETERAALRVAAIPSNRTHLLCGCIYLRGRRAS